MLTLARLVVSVVVAITFAGVTSLSHAQEFDPETFRASDSLKQENTIRPPAKVGDANNAATAYFSAWDLLKVRELQGIAAMSAEVFPDKKLPPQLRAWLSAHRDYIDGVLVASAMADCDWGPKWEAGWELLLPHLQYLRTSARALRADARRCGEDGSPIGAAERVRAMLRVSMHAADDPVLISSLVGVAIASLTVQVTEELMIQDQVTPATARLLLKAYQEVPREDFYGMRLAMERERQTTIGWLSQKCTGDHAGMEYLKLLHGMGWMVGGPGLKELSNPVLRMNEQQFQRELQRANRYYDEVLAAWNKPNAWAALWELELELREFQFGLVAIEMAPSVTKARYSVFDLKKKFAKIERRLAEIAASADEPEPEDSPKEPSKTK